MVGSNLTILDQIAKFFLLLSDASNGSDGQHDDCNGCRRRDNNQLATAAMDRDSATATQQRQQRRRWSARWSDGNRRRCGNGHEKYNKQLAKAAMDGATAMDCQDGSQGTQKGIPILIKEGLHFGNLFYIFE